MEARLRELERENDFLKKLSMVRLWARQGRTYGRCC